MGEVPWPGQDLVLLGLNESRALLSTSNAIIFFSLTAGEVVSSYPFHQLNSEGGGTDGEVWTGTMDCDPASRQFALFTSNLSSFRLLQWEDREMAAPISILQGGLRHNAGAVVAHTSSCLLLLLQCPHSIGPPTTLALHSIETGEALLEVPWPGQDLVLLGLNESRALLSTSNAIIFFSLTAGEVVSSYPFHQLNSESGGTGGEV